MALVDQVQGMLGQSAVTQVSQKLGIDPATAQTAINAAVPMIVAGMAKHAQSEQGAQDVQQATEQHADAADQVDTTLQAGPVADNSGLLGKILGGHKDTVHEGVQKASGINNENARKLLLMLSPVVLGVLARKQFGKQAAPAQPQQPAASKPQATQVQGILQQEAQHAQTALQQHQSKLGGLLGRLSL